MSSQRSANVDQPSLLRSAILALRRFAAGSQPGFATPAGMILPTTSLPPAFTPRQRAVVNAFFGRK